MDTGEDIDESTKTSKRKKPKTQNDNDIFLHTRLQTNKKNVLII